MPNEHMELELSGLGAASRSDNSTSSGVASKNLPEDSFFDGNEELSRCFGRYSGVVGV